MMFGLILLVIVAFYLFNSSNFEESRCMNHQSHTHTVQDILNERYARGEIDREDYLERKQELLGQKQRISIKKG
ncbi:SHOCT domain-containing protein [Desulfosporosinus sp. BICA1-9]|uniref:SHOCT domain-containing protein n=1 Tax=Desulfosporosinus sp. BICA1-9 TaxID=1531958 RepID=UPI00054BC2E8|nr:SHOCT domain-containing protein [Desulfosporosinus sp. BICA1-9]KJS49886.1 MAG: membrane protein [Peptococcaceae bacterium BRH_c23]KJS83262.1 MAG: membrane protein [Desulfosporosinus sp. BICA1-9]